ncbi:hypothetical protein [Flindersiella endophytica]
MTRRTRTFIATALTLGAVLAGASPALAVAAAPAARAPQSQTTGAIDVMAACFPNPPAGDGWHTTGVLYGTCSECIAEATLYSKGGWDTHCQTQAPGVHVLWIRP